MQKPEHTKQEPWKQMSSRRKNQYIQRGSCSPRQHTGSPSPVRAGGARGLLCSEHKARGQVWRCWCPSRSHINDPETGPFAKPPAGVHKMNELRKKNPLQVPKNRRNGWILSAIVCKPLESNRQSALRSKILPSSHRHQSKESEGT